MSLTRTVTVNAPRTGDFEVDALWSEQDDTIIVRVRRYYRDEYGRLYKRGIIFKVSEEVLVSIAEGQQYPVRALHSGNLHLEDQAELEIEHPAERFEQVAEEIND